MYAQIDDETLKQGDVLRGVAFPDVDYAEPLKYVATQGTADEVTVEAWDLDSVVEAAMPGPALVQVDIGHGIVVSQDCDILNPSRQYLSIARVWPVHLKVSDWEKRKPEKRVELIRKELGNPGRRPNLFYLMENPVAEFPKSVAHLSMITSVSQETTRYLLSRRILRLNAEALKAFQLRLIYLFGRFASEDDYMLTDEEKALAPQR
jgi:hypothetical protein